MPGLRSHTLDYLVERHEAVRVARGLVKNTLAHVRQGRQNHPPKPLPGARREMRDEARSLLADARRLEAQAVEQVLDGADVLWQRSRASTMNCWACAA